MTSVRVACSIVIPSYRRGQVVLDTLASLERLDPAPAEIVVVDQTEEHPASVESRLRESAEAGRFRWLRREHPSIPEAMNYGLQKAVNDLVLFLDDDIVPDTGLVSAHVEAHREAGLVAGQVLQPGEKAVSPAAGSGFRFNSDSGAWITEFMGGNFSVDRRRALALGGFDENFVGAAYRFEAEFASRWVAAYGAIRYAPSASIRHLQVASGGTRAHGHHLRTMSPGHSVGAYYFLLKTRPSGWWWRVLARPLRAIRTRHHLRRPWWIVPTLVAEVRGLLLARRLLRSGPKLVDASRFPAMSPDSSGA